MRNRRRESTRCGAAAARLGWYLGTCGALVSACGAPADDAASERAPGDPSGLELANVNPATPAEGPTTAGSLPPLPGQQTNVAGGFMSVWPDLVDAPKNLDDTWYKETIGDAYTTPKVFDSQLRSAVAQATSGIKRDSNEVGKTLATVTKFLPNATLEATDYRQFGYKAERARWLKQVSQGTARGNLYDDPGQYGEMRNRGMRLYCAAKTAATHQSDATRLMGQTSVVDTKILGARLKLLTIEPTLSLQNPLRIDTDKADGAQAFVLPFTTGVRITPVSFLPSLPELRVPMAMITADGEVVAKETPAAPAFSKWLTMSHVDGFASVAQGLHASTGKFLLFPIGPIQVMGEISVDLRFAACTQAKSFAECKAKGAQQVGRLIAGVQENNTAPLEPLPTPAREGGWTTPNYSGQGAYTDAPWNVNTGIWFSGPSGNAIATRLPDPLAMRMLQNNDKSLEVQSDATINFGLSAGGEYKVKDWLVIGAAIGGNLGAGATLVHRFREQQEMVQLEEKLDESVHEHLVPNPAMVTTLTVTPMTQGHFDFGTTAGLNIELKKIPIIGTLKLKVPVWDFQKSVPLGGRKAWPEANRLRMDNAISDAKVAHFGTTSHWPGGAAFPTYEAWDACQPADTRSTTPPAACVGREPAADTFAKNVSVPLCFYTPSWQFPPDYEKGPELDCLNALKPLLSKGVVKHQTYHGREVDAHLIDSANFEAEFTAIKQATDVCVQAFGNAGRTAEGVDRIQIGVCDQTATLTDTVFSAELDETTPGLGGTSAAGPCH
ncbi:MAG: hypothetical protein RLZZ450_5695 [Pseudomonadota bacterium]